MNIDDLLNQPLPSVADDGFSGRVIARVRTLLLGRWLAAAAGVAAFALLAVLILPWRTVGAELGVVIPGVAGLAALNLAAAVVVLTLLIERQFSTR